jgi:hypothetical protein
VLAWSSKTAEGEEVDHEKVPGRSTPVVDEKLVEKEPYFSLGLGLNLVQEKNINQLQVLGKRRTGG